MTSEQIKQLLSIVLPILGVLMGLFKDEIVNFLFGGRKYKYLEGKWTCIWIENPNNKNKAGKTINDIVTITSVFGKLIKGNGSTSILGDWSLKGEISESAITVSYKLKKDKFKHNLGTIILEVEDSNKNFLRGKWFQFNGEEIVGGDTTWIKNA